MGWAAGTDVFTRAARAFIDHGQADSDLAAAVLTELAGALCDAGWDNLDEAVDEFRGHYGVVLALLHAMDGRDFDPHTAAGTIGYDDGGGQWVLSCAEHGELGRGDGQSAEAHDLLVHEWAAHDRDYHGGDGVVDRDVLIGG